MAIPTFVAHGTKAESPNAINPAWPTHQADDIGLLFVNTAGNDPVPVVTPTDEWFLIRTEATTGGGTDKARCSVYWARAASGAESAPTVPDVGNHQLGYIDTYRGAVATGTPIEAIDGGIKGTNSTTFIVPGAVDTTQDDGLVFAVSSIGKAFTQAAWANANLANIQERADESTTIGQDGAIAYATGELATAGAIGDTDGTISDSAENAMITFSLSPTALGAFTPEQTDWRWFEDHQQDPTIAFAAENVKPVLPDDQNHVPIRLRVLIQENGGLGDTDGVLSIEASGDGTNWFVATAASGEVHVSVIDGQGINGTIIATTRLTNANTAGEYREDQVGTQTILADETGLEIDFALNTTIIVPGADYSFRLLWDGTPIPVKSGSSVIQLQGTAEADRSNTVVKLDLVSSSGEPDTLNFGHNVSLFYDGVARWWAFYNQQVAGQATTMRYKSTADLTGGWSSESTIAFTDIDAPQRQSLIFKTIGGTPYVFLMVASSGTQWYLKRGSISGSTITWDSERSITAQPSGADNSGAPVLSIDDGDFLWIAGLADGVTTDVWAAQSVNAADDATYYTFNTAKLHTDAGAEGGNDFHHIIGLASGEALVAYIDFGSGELKAVKVTQSSGFGTAVLIEAGFGGSNEADWLVTRGDDGNVYCVFKNSTSNSADLELEVYSESGDSWAAGTSPAITGVGTSSDGHPGAWGDDGKFYVFGTFVGGGGGNDTIIRYKSYTGGTSGTWDGSLTTMDGAVAGHGNKDAHIAQLSGGIPMGGKIVVIAEEGDDPNVGTEWILGFYVLDAAAAGQTIAIGTLAEVNALINVPPEKFAPIGVLTESDSLIPAGAVKEAPIGVLGESNSLIPADPLKVAGIGTLPETNPFVPVAADKPIITAVGTLPEANALNAIPPVKVATVGTLSEVDGLVSIAAVKPIITAVGTLSEADVLNAILAGKAANIGTIAEIDALLPIDPFKTADIGTIAEINALIPVAVVQPGGQDIAVGTLPETNPLIPIQARKIANIGVLTELNALIAVQARKVAPVGTLAEIDALIAILAEKRAVIGILSELNAFIPVSPTKVAGIAALPEINSLIAVQARKIASIGTVAELDSLIPVAVQVGNAVPVGVLSELDSLVALSAFKTANIGTIDETDVLRPILPRKLAPIGTISEIDALIALQALKLAQIGVLAELNALISIAAVKPIIVDIGTIAELNALITVLFTVPITLHFRRTTITQQGLKTSAVLPGHLVVIERGS